MRPTANIFTTTSSDAARWLLAWAAALCITAGAEPAAALDSTRFIAVDEIRAGMKGSGLTTFEGTEVGQFEVEVLGVLHGWSPGGDLIVIEATGGPLAETGIYRGMSGSPVYLDGRLAGAVAYNLGGFGERPIAGVTPIAEMLPILEDAASGGATLPRGLDLQGSGSELPGDVTPILTPVSLAGFHPETRRLIASTLESWGMSVAVGGSAGAGDAGGDIRPGAPVGVQMVRGDVEATALGTVTMVEDGRVLAFGHPMFNAGEVDLPMTSARVYTVYPSQAISFVIGAAAHPVGRVRADRQSGILGELGSAPPMVPVAIEVVRPDGQARTFSYELMSNKFFITQFLGFLAFNALVTDQKSFGDATVEMHMQVEFEGGTRLSFDDVIASTTTPQLLAQRVAEPLAGILQSGIERVTVDRVALELKLSPSIRRAQIEEIVVDQTTVEAGESIHAVVYLRLHEAGRQPVRIDISVPEGLGGAPLLLRACSADEATEWEGRRAPRRRVPESLEQYVDLFKEGTARNRLRVALYADARGVVVGGREMMGLPGSVFSIMDTGKRTGGRSGSWGRLVHQEQVDTEWQLSGCRELRIDVKQPALTVAPRPGRPVTR